MKLISDRKSKKLEKKVTNKLAPGTTLDRNKRFIDKFLKNIINFNKKYSTSLVTRQTRKV